ncbi:hypothetical protein M758_10G157200 [Ceratodon purpureus]|nr:hypothetical protein M758_10G157200 [Ceratodon purpureus]
MDLIQPFLFAFIYLVGFRDLLTERTDKRSVNVCKSANNVVPKTHSSARCRADLSLSSQLDLIFVSGYQHRNGYLIDHPNLHRFRDLQMMLSRFQVVISAQTKVCNVWSMSGNGEMNSWQYSGCHTGIACWRFIRWR